MSNRRNYYRILHVQPDAPVPVIRSSYRAVLQKLKRHPDLGGDHSEAALINQAYAVLTNPAKRAAYDRELMQFHSKSTLGGERFHKQGSQAPAGTADQPEPSRDEVNEAGINAYCVFCKLPHDAQSRHQHDATCACCASPLSLAAPMALEKSCRRAVKRVAKDAQVHFYTDWPQRHRPGRLQDISPNGMSFMTSEYVAEAQIIKLASGLVHAVAEVMSCQRTAEHGNKAYSVGVHFLTLRFQQNTGTFVYEQV
jgi:hypothetical protein